LTDFNDKLDELNNKLTKVKQDIIEQETVDDEIVDYLKVKHQVLLSYCVNLIYYMSFKSKGESVKEKPVMNRLLELRLLMEKMRPLDGKLKYQIDRLIKYSTLDTTNNSTENLRPDPDALLNDFDDDENDDNDNNNDDDYRNRSKDKGKHFSSDVYKAPKLVAMPYKENESNKEKLEKQLLKKRSKLKNSEILESLREEFGVMPEVSSSSGLSGMNDNSKVLRKEAEERRRYEEERFIRTVMSRKDKQKIKQSMREATRFDNFTKIGDIGDFEELADLAKDHTSNGGYDKFDMIRDDRKEISIDLNASLKKAVSALSRPKVAKREREIPQTESIHNDKKSKTKKSEKDLLRSFASNFKKEKRQKVM
jgi:hypothetical protein